MIPGLKLDARLKKYGLEKVFAYVCSDRNLFIEAYDDDNDLWTYHIANEFDDLWTYHIANEFDNCLPVS